MSHESHRHHHHRHHERHDPHGPLDTTGQAGAVSMAKPLLTSAMPTPVQLAMTLCRWRPNMDAFQVGFGLTRRSHWAVKPPPVPPTSFK